MRPTIPSGIQRAREFAAKVKSPVGQPFAAARKGQAATLYLYDMIGKDPWTGEGTDAKDIVAAIEEAKGADSLEIHVNSPGGYVFEGIAIFNAIRSFSGAKTVYVDGVAASIASIIALAGDRVIMNEGSMFMIHDPMGGLFSMGSADQIEEDARKTVVALRKCRETLLDIYTNATGRTVSEVSAWMTAETWMTAAEALDRGFADEIVKQPAADPAPASARASAPAAVSPRAQAELARARVRALSEKFPGASPGSQRPGQPGPKQTPSDKEATR
jgi:ATP-dependent protease ClpP protease subunit